MQETPPTQMVLRYFLILFLVSILLVGRLLWPFLSILILSYLLTGIFKPVYLFFNRLLSKKFSSLLTCSLIIFLVFLPLVFFVGALSQEAFSLYEWGKGANLGLKLKEFHNSAFMGRFQNIMGNFGVDLKVENINQALSDLAKVVGLSLYNQASAWAANVMQFVMQFFMMILTIFFLLIDQEKLINYALRLSPLPDDQERRLFCKFEEIAGAVLVGNGVCGLIQGVLGGILFTFLELGPPVLWGGVMAILAFLPIFGIGLVLIPAGIILLLKGSMTSGAFVLIFYVILSFSVEYILKPKMVGEQVKMHTLVVFLSIMGGLATFGFLGIIYGPLIITAFLTLADIYMTNYDKYVKAGSCDK
ncbi:MAG: AI-2E family transporter [Desulfobulbaceae bacterium]|nr:AI-2E family transporter [Desulfobulbaceae bacterium]